VESTQYLSLADVVAIHERVMLRLGDEPKPLRSEGLLESAITRPKMAAWYEGADLVRQAALLGVGISQAQAFLDGNKRTAYLATVTFLQINGLAYAGDHIALAEQFELVAERSSETEAALDDFESWLRGNVRPRSETA
jgi:death on curing protein